MARADFPEAVGPVITMSVGFSKSNQLFLCYDAADVDYYIACFLYRLDWNKFKSSVEILTAGKDIGAGETLERKLCTVCAAADGLHFRFYAGVAHGFFSDLDYMHHGFDFLAHVVILILDLNSAASGIFHICFAHKVLDFAFAAFEAGAVMVADNVGEGCFLNAAFYAYKVIETLVILGMLVCFPTGKHGDEVVRNAD